MLVSFRHYHHHHRYFSRPAKISLSVLFPDVNPPPLLDISLPALNLLVLQLRQLPRRTHVAHLLRVTLREDEVDLLEAPVGCLGVEQPDYRQEGRVHGGKEQIRPPADVLDHHRRDHHDGEVEQPVAAGRDGVGSGARLDGRDLGWVEPGQRQPGRAEEAHVQEQTHHGAGRTVLVAWDQTHKYHRHGYQLPHRSPQEQLASPDPLDEEPREGREDGVHDHVDAANQQCHVVRLAQRLLQQHRQVVDNRVAAAQLLEDLRRGADEHAPEMLCPAGGEEVGHGGVAQGAGAAYIS